MALKPASRAWFNRVVPVLNAGCAACCQPANEAE
jgi:hypothetical protein